jgi:NADPH-dependent 2,4-dienoyl-CoA reductase/sulfur reductase-like enzyme/nitrite reductase/ring-hydroxylating ferredoxin subunit
MSDSPSEAPGPDLAAGVPVSQLDESGPLLGHVGDEPVLIVRRGGEVFATGATCTHYGGPLAEGLIVGETVRCPWHHACFSLRTGEALHAPALRSVAAWAVETRDGKLFVLGKRKRADRRGGGAAQTPGTVVILGGGAAGIAAAAMLRQEGHAGRIVMVSADSAAPYDRPNLSKDYLAGKAPEDWIPLFSEGFYRKNGIELRLRTRVEAIDTRSKRVQLSDGATESFDALLLATGAEPVRLDVPGAGLPHVHYLRSLDDCRAIIAGAGKAQRAVVVGASFIGMEVAASLRTRGIDVHVVAPEKRPMERVLGPQLGDYLRRLHEEHGVTFHLEQTVVSIDDRQVTLSSGKTIAADLVVIGIGVRPVTAIAESAGIALDRGIAVNEYLETSVPGIFAAGDIARWPDPRTGQRIRVEHWVVAERQGQTAARNILGQNRRFDAVPFFWTQHYEAMLSYVGHAERWDTIDIEGDIASGNCKLTYRQAGNALAVVTMGRDRESLEAEAAMEARHLSSADAP